MNVLDVLKGIWEASGFAALTEYTIEKKEENTL